MDSLKNTDFKALARNYSNENAATPIGPLSKRALSHPKLINLNSG